MNLQYYANDIRNPRPKGSVALGTLLDRIRKPKNVAIYEQILDAELKGDKATKAKLKQQLYYIVPAANVEGTRKYSNIVNFTGLLHLDFDHLDNAAEFRDFLFSEYPFIIAAWLSASRHGVKALVSIPIVQSVAEYKALFWGLESDEMAQYVGFDYSPQNAVLPLFLSYDPDIKTRTNAQQWTGKASNPRESKAYQEVYKIDYDPANASKQLNFAVSKIQHIDTVGHPIVRAVAFTLGGYVGAGLVDMMEAEQVLTAAIRSNKYLSKGTDGYIKTALQMLHKGALMPLLNCK